MLRAWKLFQRHASKLGSVSHSSCAQPATVPLIDISAFTEAPTDESTRSAVAAEWDAAMSDVGFAVINGHGVPARVISDLREAANDFFALDLAAKQQFTFGDYGNPDGGYTAVGSEAVARTRDDHGSDGGADWDSVAATADLVQSFVFRAHAPTPPSIMQAAIAYEKELKRVLQALHQLTATALKLPLDFFDPYYSPHADVSLRLASYPPLPTDAEYSRSIRYGEHTDYTGFTILHQDENDVGAMDAGGLQVLLPSGEWYPVRPEHGCFVVNIGDLYQIWTNDRWRSTVHRVTNPAVGSVAAGATRLSIPFFTGPHNDALIETIPTCVSPSNPAKHAPVKALDHLLSKLAASNV